MMMGDGDGVHRSRSSGFSALVFCLAAFLTRPRAAAKKWRLRGEVSNAQARWASFEVSLNNLTVISSQVTADSDGYPGPVEPNLQRNR